MNALKLTVDTALLFILAAALVVLVVSLDGMVVGLIGWWHGGIRM